MTGRLVPQNTVARWYKKLISLIDYGKILFKEKIKQFNQQFHIFRVQV